jgi:O-antigen/teichoic acid export membrane protein
MLSASTGLLSTLIIIPIALHELGAEQYGLWIVLWQLIGYLSLLDLGVAYAATRDLAAAHSLGDRRTMVEIVSSGFYLYLGLGVVFFAFGWLILPVLPHVTLGSQATVAAARLPLLLLLVHGLLAFPMRFLSSANIGAQVIAASSLVGFLQGVTNTVIAAALLLNDAGLIALPIAVVSSDLIALVLQSIIFARTYGFSSLSPSEVRASAAFRLLGFSLPLLVSGMGWTIVAGTDSVVISARLGLMAVALFAVSYRIPSQLVQLMNLATDVTMPGLTSVMTAESLSRRSATYAELLGLVGVFSGVLAAGVVVLLRPFMGLWVGPDQVADQALVLVMAYLVVHHPVQHVLAVALVAARQVRLFAAVTLAEAGVNLGLSIVAAGLFGVPGVLYATAASGWINLGYALWKSSRSTFLRPRQVLAAAFGNAATAVGMGLMVGFLVGLFRFETSWVSFVLGAGIWMIVTLGGLAIVDRILLRGRLHATIRTLLNSARSAHPLQPIPDQI